MPQTPNSKPQTLHHEQGLDSVPKAQTLHPEQGLDAGAWDSEPAARLCRLDATVQEKEEEEATVQEKEEEASVCMLGLSEHVLAGYGRLLADEGVGQYRRAEVLFRR